MFVIVAIVVDRTVVYPALKSMLSLPYKVMVAVFQYRGVCMSVIMLIDVMLCQCCLNKHSGKRAAMSVSFSKNLVSSSGVR